MLSLPELRALLPSQRIDQLARTPVLTVNTEHVVAPVLIFPIVRWGGVAVDFLFHNRDAVANRTISLNRQPAKTVGPNAVFNANDQLVGEFSIDHFATAWDLSIGIIPIDQVKRLKVDEATL
jgi:hypothetical protein